MSSVNLMVKLLDDVDVVAKPLSEVAEIKRGTSITQKDVTPGEIPVIAGGRTPAYFHNASNRTGQTIVIAGSGAYAGFVSWWEQPIFVSDAFTVKPYSDLLSKYCFYWLQGLQQQLHELKSGGGVPHVYPRDVAPLQIPIPCPDNPKKSLEIQVEIVRILDAFTKLTAEVIAELRTELIDRQKQHGHYRDLMFEFEDGAVEWRELGDLFPFIRNGFVGTVTPYYTDASNGVRYLQGTNIQKGTINDNKKYYITRDFHEKLSRTKLQSTDILIVQSGHVGESAVVGDNYANCNCHALIVMSNGGQCNSKFVNYFLQTAEGKGRLSRITTGETVKHILASKIKKMAIPLPSIATQARIVAILEKLDARTNSLTEGLPREIELRQKQYEYYRERLFSFPKREEAEA